MRYRLILFKLMIVFGQLAIAQESVLENWTMQSDEALQEEDIQFLLNLKNHPLDINTCSLDDLQRIPGLHPVFAAEIIKYREKYGDFQSLYELQIIPGADINWLKNNKDLFTCSSHLINELRNNKKYKQHLLLRWKPELQNKLGYSVEDQNRFVGNRQGYYLRYRGELGKYLFSGLSIEKDPGEAILLDHIGGFLKYRNPNKLLQELVLGDFQLSLGQGLLFSSVRQVFAGEVTDGLSAWNGVQAVASSNEQFYQRGIAACFRKKFLNLKMAYSRRKLDAKFNEDSTYTFYSSGLHRTKKEMESRKKLIEQDGFMSLSASFSKFQVALNYHINRLAFQTIQQSASIDFRYLKGSSYTYGELAITQNIKKGLIGHLWSLDDKNDLHFQALANFNLAFSHSQSQTFLKWSSKLGRKDLFRLFLNLENYQLAHFRNDAPSRKYEVSLIYSMPKRLKLPLEFRFKAENYERNQEANKESIRKGENILAFKWRLQSTLFESEQLRLIWRSEFSRFKSQSLEKGQLHYIDLAYTNENFSSALRYTFFNTAGYDTRIYTYERDVLYSFSVPAFQNSGQRFYFLVNTKIQNLKISFRYGLTWYPIEQESGSGADSYSSTQKHDFKLQLSASF